MKQIAVVSDDKVGVLADISYLLGKAKINIESISAVAVEGKAILTIFVKEEKRAAGILVRNGYHVLESEALVIRLKDEPGQLSRVSQMLSDAGVNLITLYVIAKEKGITIVALKTDKLQKAKKLLAPYLNIESD